MICSKCSAKVRPIVALDIDGTLGDYHGHFLEFARKWLGYGIALNSQQPHYPGDVLFRDWFCDEYKTDLTTFRKIKLAYRAGGQKRTMPVYEYASGLSVSLAQMNIEIWLTTTRPYMRLDGIDEDTREWLRRNDIAYDHLLYDEEKYAVLNSQIDPQRVVAVLDDEVEQLRKAEGLWGSGVPILRGNLYNRAHHDTWNEAFAPSLMEALELIANRLYGWREKNG